MDIHTDFKRPPEPAGHYLRACLMTAPPSTLDKLIVFADRIVKGAGDPDLAEIMAAVGLDALAARHELDDVLGDILDGRI